MIQVACSALLFDLDGVLIDSTHAGARVWTQWADEHGLDPAKVVPRAHGQPTINTVKEFLPTGNHEAEASEVDRREIADVAGVVAWPGARELLTALPLNRWTIVTSCTRALAAARLTAAGLQVPELIVTADDVAHGKPAPEPYLLAAALLDVPPDDCIVVEDVPVGVRAATAAGCRVIAVRTTVKDPELRAAGANWVADDCAAISVQPRWSDQDQVLVLLIDVNPINQTPATTQRG